VVDLRTTITWQSRLACFTENCTPGGKAIVSLYYLKGIEANRPVWEADGETAMICDPLRLGGVSGAFCIVVSINGVWVLSSGGRGEPGHDVLMPRDYLEIEVEKRETEEHVPNR
jgi:hypothetical protein